MSDRFVLRLVHTSGSGRIHGVRPFRLECGYEKKPGGMVAVDFNELNEIFEGRAGGPAALEVLRALWLQNRRRCMGEADLPRILVPVH